MKCTFCNREIKEGTGILYVKRDGTSYNFCSSKCEKNMLRLHRKATKMKWVSKNSSKLKKSKTKQENSKNLQAKK